eukprot:jgi/Ulvmu1/2042/UM120_0038.1
MLRGRVCAIARSSGVFARAFGRPFSTVEQEEVFDRDCKALHRSRAALSLTPDTPHDALHHVCAERLLDKVRDVTKRFSSVLVVGGAGRTFMSLLCDDAVSSQITNVSYMDQSLPMALKVKEAMHPVMEKHGSKMDVAVADEEFLPFTDAKFDLVVACNALHWVNDLPRAFKEFKRVLQPDGMFLASMLGGDTLWELRAACQMAEEERDGGFSLRTSPLIHVRDAGSLLSGAGFTLQTVDTEDLTVQYEDVADAITHLRVSSEQNAAMQRRGMLPRDTALAAAALYAYGEDARRQGGVCNTFQMISLTGWAPDRTQPRAAKRGSATVSMKDLPGSYILLDKQRPMHSTRTG